MTVPKYHHVSQNTPSVTSHILQHSLQNSLLLHNFMNPKMFLLAHFVTGSNDYPIPLIANFRLIMSHKLSRKPHALVILGVNLESTFPKSALRGVVDRSLGGEWMRVVKPGMVVGSASCSFVISDTDSL